MRTVLVCVRTSLAAQTVASAAARLGMAAAVRTAISAPEVMLRLAERPADIVLADTALTRPDSIGFIRRVLGRAPKAVIVLFGAEDPRVASAAVAAGARGLIQGGAHDLVSVVAKALLLLCVRGGSAAGVDAAVLPGASTGSALPATVTGGVPGGTGVAAAAGAGSSRLAGGRAGAEPGAAPSSAASGDEHHRTASSTDVPGQPGGAMVPAQRGDEGGPSPEPDPGRYADTERSAPAPDPRSAAAGGLPEGAVRRIGLTEREMQVLRGMADGKSNAEIGRDLFVSEDTVKTHARRLFRKLGARDRAHAVAAGFRAGLVA